LGLQDFDFMILSKFHFNFALILPKSFQIYPGLTNFAQTNFARGRSCIPSSYDTNRNSF